MPAINIYTIYESEAFRLLSRHMKDKHAVGIVYATMIADDGKDTLFRELESMADELLADDCEKKAPLQVAVGDLTMRHIFNQAGITNIANENQQALWNRVEEVLVALEKSLDDATGDARIQKEELLRVTETNRQTIFDLEARLEQQEHYNKAAIARRDDRIADLKAEVAALKEMVKERDLRYENSTHGLHKRLGDVHEKLFHDDPTNTEERVHRFLEEAIEVAHAIYVPLDDVIQLAKYVYQGKRGSLNEELSDAAITLASLCRYRERDFMSVVFNGLHKLESPERIERVRKKRANRKGRGALPGLLDTSGMTPKSVTTTTIGDVMQSRDFSTGEPATKVSPAQEERNNLAVNLDGVGRTLHSVADQIIGISRKL